MFDLNKIKNAANKLGINLKTNSENPGIHFIGSNGYLETLTFDEIKNSLLLEFENDIVKKDKKEVKYNIAYFKHFSVDIDSEDAHNEHFIHSKVSFKLALGGESTFSENPIELERIDEGTKEYKEISMEAA